MRNSTASAELPANVLLLDALDPASIAEYLLARRLAAPGELPCHVERAGDGNMNLTLRVRLRSRTVILKQGRPWVEKYDHIAAPWDRTLVEGAFYRAVQSVPSIAGCMPALLDMDEYNHVLVIEDLGAAGDHTSLYSGAPMNEPDLDVLLAWLAALPRVQPAPVSFTNRDMRALNHEHIFRLPLARENALNLDSITRGLAGAADQLQGESDYCSEVAGLGRHYLADGSSLVHGDYFPGSWVRTRDGVRIIDPEFCFFGAREFDYGVMLAHFALARTDVGPARRVLAAGRSQGLDESWLLGFAGTEIMRRLIGVAQLPLPYGLDEKRRLLDVSRSLVLAPATGLTCWS